MASSMVPMTSLSPPEDRPTTYTYDETNGTTSELQITSMRFSGSPEAVILSFLFVICIFGFIANLAMLVSLLLRKHAASKTVNVFICNQTVLDLVATSVSAVKLSLVTSGYLMVKTGVLRQLVCVLIESDAVTSSAIYGSVYGLVMTASFPNLTFPFFQGE